MARKNIYIILIMLLLLAVITTAVSGCRKVFFMPGASYGYYVWEEEGKIHISWSVDRKDTAFSGFIETDGRIESFETVDWEEADIADAGENRISYSSTLDEGDYTDGMIIEIADHEYIELDLMINGGYDLSRVHLGAFLENPTNSPFRIEKDHFDNVSGIPWYGRHPFSGLFYKLFSNKYFTFPYIFILGVVIIEIIRITYVSTKKRKSLYTAISYIILICLEIMVYFILRFFVL
ncbi:MAG: hypothetical protein K8S14_10165 [Actinomycetia bacterium]|nr:hypothetical protein [Actinomycetes bacterium]